MSTYERIDKVKFPYRVDISHQHDAAMHIKAEDWLDARGYGEDFDFETRHIPKLGSHDSIESWTFRYFFKDICIATEFALCLT
jgi:hypothetical protein